MTSYFIKGNAAAFFKNTHYLVVGASTNKAKFGNKILRGYIANNKNAIPINMKEETIESIPCVSSITSFVNSNRDLNVNQIGVSICTPPKITLSILKEAYSLGLKEYLLQPGTIDDDCMHFIDNTMLKDTTTDKDAISPNTQYMNVITSCVLQELHCTDILAEGGH